MDRIIMFYVAQVSVTALATWRGGTPERITGFILLIAALVTSMIPFESHKTFYGLEWTAMYVDVGLFVVLLGLAMRADRFWPLWLAALQLVTVGVHAVRAYDPVFLPIVYARLAGQIAYPMLVLLLLGTLRHHRRITAGGPERAWSEFRW